ncbi:unnamed protein product [Rotaria sp. Silwood1]|nr:unnamed protein product [Rotaria sp. Silwood1]CAF1638257.1 unnamed protein product [Rotaria sp. Silwood1]
MKLSFCQNKKNIYERLYNATYRSLSSLLPPLCSQVLFNDSNIQSQYISPKTEEYGIQSFDLVRIAYDEKYLITHFEFIAHLSSNKPLTFFISAAFDKDYKLCGYDGQIRNIGLTLDPRTDVEREAKINTICNVTQRVCSGILQQYSNFNDCQQFLRTQIPYGSYDRADQGNVICRFVHTYFVPLLPSIHCPHVGPTGGGACTDKTIDFYYNQTNFLACAHKQ